MWPPLCFSPSFPLCSTIGGGGGGGGGEGACRGRHSFGGPLKLARPVRGACFFSTGEKELRGGGVQETRKRVGARVSTGYDVAEVVAPIFAPNICLQKYFLDTTTL